MHVSTKFETNKNRYCYENERKIKEVLSTNYQGRKPIHEYAEDMNWVRPLRYQHEIKEQVEQSSDNRCVLAICLRTCLSIVFPMA